MNFNYNIRNIKSIDGKLSETSVDPKILRKLVNPKFSLLQIKLYLLLTET